MSITASLLNLEKEGTFRRAVPLSLFSTFKIGGNADFFLRPRHLQDLLDGLEWVTLERLPYRFIGNGSNLLFSDEGFRGLIICLSAFETEKIVFSDDRVTASSGVSSVLLSMKCLEHLMSGLEFMSTIPGTVGGSVVMNAGYGRSRDLYQDTFAQMISLEILREDGRTDSLEKEEVDYGYRSTNLNGQLVIEATFQLERGEQESIYRQMKENANYRSRIQDLRFPSAGSIFKNPRQCEFTAGELIDRSGLRGYRIGRAAISEKHGNFIVNLGGAKAGEVKELILLAQEEVGGKFGIHLELELHLLESNKSHFVERDLFEPSF